MGICFGSSIPFKGKEHCSHMANLELIKTYGEALQNAKEFRTLTPSSDSQVFRNFGQFSQWYYFPELDSFAPSKFVGFANSSLATYDGGQSGYDTGGRNSGKSENVLSSFFRKIDRDSDAFQILKSQLDSYASGLGKTISVRVTSGKGAIHVPKEWDISTLIAKSTKSGGSGLRLASASTTAPSEVVSDDYESAKAEGKALFRLHRQLERDSQILRKAKLKRLNDREELTCDACSFDFTATYGELGDGFIEGHHTTPISQLDGETKTKVSDIALLCANCHRMIHRRPAMSVADLRELVEQQRRSL